MIITVTPNPSFDRTVHVESLEFGAVHRVSTVTVEAGGKGVNVARALALGGTESTCIFPAGADDAPAFTRLLGDIAGMTPRTVHTAGSIRTNVGIIETGGRTTKLNESGSALDAVAQDELLAAIVDAGATADWVAICGSYPPGLPADFIQRVRDGLPAHVGLGVDASGEPLEHAVRAGCDLIKPNHHELAALLDRSIDTLGDVVDAALEVQRDGVATVVVSLGSRGALLVSDDGVTFGYAPAESVKNTVGAGDAFFAGFLAAGGSGSKSLSEALAWGRAAVSSASTAFPPATDVDRAAVVISSEIDRALQMEQ